MLDVALTRVFHLIKSLGRGGAETLLTEGLRFSDREQFAYGYGYFLPWKTAMVPLLEEQGVEVVCFGHRNNLSILWSARRVATYLRGWHADLVHCHLPIAGIVGRLAGRLSGIPVIYTEHNRMERYHPLTSRLNLLTWRWQERVLAVSKEVASSIQAHASEEVPVQIILNGVDTDRFDRGQVDGGSARRALGIPDTARVVGTVAVFRAQKRLDEWLTVARHLRDWHHDLHFLLVGDGPLREDLVARVRSLGMGGVVHFPGLQEDVRPYLATMDVFLSSSVFEGLPVALLEAMSMRCAVVATAIGGVPEVVRHGENGYLAEPRQPDALARLTSDLLASPETSRRFGERARTRVVNDFGLRRMTRELETTYLDVLNGSRHNG